MIERSPLIEIECNSENYEVIFSPNGEYILSRGYQAIEVWRVKDGERMARMDNRLYNCLSFSPDGRWIAAGADDGAVYVWDANTYEQAFILQNNDAIHGVDFSPDSTRLVIGSDSGNVVWNVATRRRERVFDALGHGSFVKDVKYSLQGDQILIATDASFRIHDSNDGRLSVDIPTTMYTNFRWLKDRLVIASPGRIKEVDTSSGATISEWTVPFDYRQITALPHQKEFLAYSTGNTITFWDTSMHHQFDSIQNTGNIGAISFSPDDRFIATAISGFHGKIIIYEVSRTTAPFIDLPETVSRSWLRNQLAEVEEFLTKKITSGSNQPSYQAHAYRALIHARSGRWNTAIQDAEKSIEVRPSIIGYIAKSLSLIGGGYREKVGRVFDLATRHIQLYDNADPLLLIKAVVLFMAGDRDEAMSRVDDLITTLSPNSICHVVLAYMYLLLGESYMDNGNYDSAIQSYERAKSQMRPYAGPFLRTITFISGWQFDALQVTIKQHLCEALYAAGRTKDASECFVEMVISFDEEAYICGSVSKWVSDFVRRYDSAPEVNWIHDAKLRCTEKLVHFGDVAVDTQWHDDAIIHYTTALSFDPFVPRHILLKRSKAREAMGLWQDALNDANEVIDLDSSSPWGYERKYVVLSVAGRHKEKSDALEMMLSKMAQSSDPATRERAHQFPKTQETVRGVVQDAIRDLPPVLINTTSGQLCDRSKQAVAFELLPSYAEFALTLTTQTDVSRIRREVAKYYRYATFSHKNEANEPLFDEVISTAVYELEESPTHEKLQKFCKIVRDAGIHWAWSNTCCVDTSNHSALQEALTSMFRWYQESAFTVIYLVGVSSPSHRGDLVRSIWNTRAWMFQEYHASKAVRFYNNDWTLYRNLDIPNHKESPKIIRELEKATGMSRYAWEGLSPGLSNIRSKLYLASSRETTLVEDAAYSLFGIFSLSLPVVYGEGDKALGHLLSHLLTKSGDADLLAWTGTSGTFNSCLPSNTSVFHEQFPSHVQPFIENVVYEVATSLRSSSQNISFLTKLIDRLKELPPPWFAGQELKLPCLTFKVESVSESEINSDRVFHIQASALGEVDIKTREDLSQFESLILIFPWIDFLFDRQPRNGSQTPEEESEYEGSVDDVLAFPAAPSDVKVPLTTLVQQHALRIVARLKRFRRTRVLGHVALPPVPPPIGPLPIPLSRTPSPVPVPFPPRPIPVPRMPPPAIVPFAPRPRPIPMYRTPSPVPMPPHSPIPRRVAPPPVPVPYVPPRTPVSRSSSPTQESYPPPIPPPVHVPPPPLPIQLPRTPSSASLPLTPLIPPPAPRIPPFPPRIPPFPPIQGTRQMKAVRFAARLKQPFDAFLMVPDAHDAGKYRRVAADCRITVQVAEITALVLKQLLEGVQVLDVL